MLHNNKSDTFPLAGDSRWLVQAGASKCDAIDVWCVQTNLWMCKRLFWMSIWAPAQKYVILTFLELWSSIMRTCMYTLGISIAILVAAKEKSEKQKASCFCCHFCQRQNGPFPLWTQIDKMKKTKGKDEMAPSQYQCIIRSLSLENLAFLSSQYRWFRHCNCKSFPV